GGHKLVPAPVATGGGGEKKASGCNADLDRGQMVALGEFGNPWLGHQSLRTLTNARRRGGLDSKLPLTIYNTSCYRGIPGRYIAAGPLA
ncbi:IucA/IucC family siderophore biosynthesis protein, partial [Escherichia coli]|nr:IucA/IucC family siderophore biosynthesis protein [Escherichia coli]